MGVVRLCLLISRMLFLLLLFLAIFNSEAFNTAKCDHDAITADLVDLDNCLNYKNMPSNPMDDDTGLCGVFNPSQDCLTKHLGECFEDNQMHKAGNETLAQIRKDTIKYLFSVSSNGLTPKRPD
eukprot:TRINITY_DN7876_c0_g1_i2.p1 TRINITY_DN7876_c0_g1~~TRINITY_DN7876_c0_g1_i2.p1  ORF type:complete len:132 (+),score=26.91 TRINITY_DN7876_c0_g1_i2:26-397(+)